jgi:hypothetical protein
MKNIDIIPDLINPIQLGSGKFIFDPITIDITDEFNYIKQEYKIINIIGHARMVQWEVVSQTLHFKGDRKIDQITIVLKDPIDDEITFEDYFFDVTECFDRFSVETGEYLNDIGK